MTDSTGLRRSLSLSQLVLYGLGTTIGAGIYALTGKVAGVAEMNAPATFLVASAMAGFTAFSYAEISARHPQSAGSAEYVRQAFRLAWLPTVVGLLVVLTGTVSAGTISNAFVGYVRELVPVPHWLGVIGIVALLGLVAAWGISESVTTAAIITVIEVGGLLLVIGAGGVHLGGDLSRRWVELLPGLELSAWSGILGAALLAFYAYLGFEDMVTVAEEVVDVHRVLPRAIVLTLVLSTGLYVVVAAIAVLVVAPADLSASGAPLALVWSRATGGSTVLISIIGILALVNGALVQVIMGARMLYGMAVLGKLPAWLARVHPRRRTPVVATTATCLAILVLALLFPLAGLAEAASALTLAVFALVNAALLLLKRRGPPPASALEVPAWVPIAGLLISSGFVLRELRSLIP